MKILFVIGTRPEAIKLAPVIREAEKFPKSIQPIVCAAGQHRELLEQALSVFKILPDESLDLMDYDQALSALTERLVSGLSDVIKRHQPDWVLIQGDTTTAFVATLSAFYQHIPVAHVEAGMRTGNLKSPFPEEGNRQMIARLSSLHFAATKLAASRLVSENISSDKILVTGNTVVDAVEHICKKPLENPMLVSIEDGKDIPLSVFPEGKRLVLVTCHRRESFGSPLEGILKGLRDLAERYKETDWIFPVHPNPNVRGPVMKGLGGIPNVRLVDPVDYQMALELMKRSEIIVSDSGGIQEEAPCFGVPVVVMREHTEREEGISAGFSVLVGSDPVRITSAARAWLDHPEKVRELASKPNPYGDGRASERIIGKLLGHQIEPFDG